MHWLLIAGMFVLVTGCATLASLLFVRFWRAPSRLRRFATNALLTCFSAAYAFVALEVFFYAVYVESMNYAATTGAKRWVDLYW